jgi:multidrug efflux pump subunit AcrA (membrane-fusion protein)
MSGFATVGGSRPITAAALLVALVALAGGCAPREASDDAAAVAPEARVRVAGVEMRRFTPAIRAPGQWRSTGELVIAAPFAAYVETVRVEVGDRVPRGGLVATLTTRESRAALVGAEQMLAAATDPAGRAEAERAVAEARRELVRVPVVAGATGVVTHRAVGAGAQVSDAAELVTLLPESGVVFEAHVPLRDAARVAVGQTGRITGEDGVAVPAVVRRRLPLTAAGDQNALVWLAPLAPVSPAWLDRYGTATLVTGAPHEAPGVPDSAIVEDDLTGQVRVARVVGNGRNGVLVWTSVRLGAGEDGWHELLDPPLPAGTRVVVEGQRGLPDSTRITIRP